MRHSIAFNHNHNPLVFFSLFVCLFVPLSNYLLVSKSLIKGLVTLWIFYPSPGWYAKQRPNLSSVQLTRLLFYTRHKKKQVLRVTKPSKTAILLWPHPTEMLRQYLYIKKISSVTSGSFRLVQFFLHPFNTRQLTIAITFRRRCRFPNRRIRCHCFCYSRCFRCWRRGL